MVEASRHRRHSQLALGVLTALPVFFIDLETRAEESATSPSQTAAGQEGSAPTTPPPPRTSATEVTVHAETDVVGPRYRSPGLAVALSLTPVPVDFGNLYAENIPWGAAYTTAEVVLMTPMMWLLGDHMHHGNEVDRTWSDEERGWAAGLVAGYVLVKVVSGVHAGFAAASFNREHGSAALFTLPSVATIPGGALLDIRKEF